MFKSFVKKLLYLSGLLSALHVRNNRHALTVVLFHRVMSVTDPRWRQVDMEWSVSDVFFRDCLRFFDKHYNFVTLKDVQDCYESGVPLPDYPLLITFDDGWSDNLEYALPIAKDFNVRPLLFVTTDAIGKPMLSWQETLYSTWRINTLTDTAIRDLFALLNQSPQNLVSEADIQNLIRQLQHSGNQIKSAAADIASKLSLPHPIQMLTQDELRQLGTGFDFGTHGVRHEPLTQSDDPLSELEQARKQLSVLTNDHLPISMSYPHGRYTSELLDLTKSAGYTLIFTGIECLNKSARKSHAILGRLNINQNALQDNNGRLIPEYLALNLFRRPIKEH